MVKPKPVAGYRSYTHAVQTLKKEGWSNKEISTELGIPLSSVSAMDHASRALKPITLTDKTIERLRPHAEARGISINKLVNRIMFHVLDDNLVNAILDDEPAYKLEHEPLDGRNISSEFSESTSSI